MAMVLKENYKCWQVEKLGGGSSGEGDTPSHPPPTGFLLALPGNVFTVKISIFNASSTLGY